MMDWTSFKRKIYINERPEALFKLWATPKGLTTWFLRRADFKQADQSDRSPKDIVQVGDTYTWSWHNWDQYDAHGEIKESDGHNRLVFSFEKSIVSIDISHDGEKSLVTLTQSDIPTDEESKMQLYVGCSNGWTFWLANLKSYCEHGMLINDTSGNVRDGMEWVNM